MGILNNTEFDSDGRVARMGTNQIGRYAVHFHHDFGPKTPSNGYQFTLVGNVVDGSSKWGITVHRSHYGLIQDNVVYNTRGAGIVTEDGSESFNVFDHNFSLRTAGSRDAAPGNGYSGVAESRRRRFGVLVPRSEQHHPQQRRSKRGGERLRAAGHDARHRPHSEIQGR